MKFESEIGKTVIPFATSGGGGMERTDSVLKNATLLLKLIRRGAWQ
jgi:hypothetical protein